MKQLDDKPDFSNSKCWICGGDATSGEHRTKKSDLRAQFGSVDQSEPLYFHDNNKKNHPIGSFKANALKFPNFLCIPCNTTRTQPHDRAWEKLSAGLRARKPKIRVGSIVRANRIFTYRTAQEMLNVHLYFVKIFGCHVAEHKIQLDTKALSTAILNGKAHPGIYLKFGITSLFAGEPWIGASNALAEQNSVSGNISCITWLQTYGDFAVQFMYLAGNEKREGLIEAWHPKMGTNKLVFANFTNREDSQEN